MENKNYRFLNTISPVSESLFKRLQNISSFKSFKKDDVVTNFCEVPTKAYLLVDGVMRAFIQDDDGKEYNKNIFTPMSFVASFTSLIHNKPSNLCYQALTNCKTFELDYGMFLSICKEDLQASLLYSRVLERVFVTYEKRNLELLSLDATQRYEQLRSRIPNIDSLIPQYQIASYLNITPVQLSRIRNAPQKN